MRAFHMDEMKPTGEMCYIMGGVSYLAKTMASRIRAFSIKETVLHGVWEPFCNVR